MRTPAPGAAVQSDAEKRAREMLLACPRCGGQPFASAPDIGRVMCCVPYATPLAPHVKAVAQALTESERRGMERAAEWLDREYEFLAAVSVHDRSDAASQGAGMRAALAETAALLRQWAKTGKRPENRKVPAQTEIAAAIRAAKESPMPDELEAKNVDMLRHALGIQKRGKSWTKPCRNHFVAGDDDRSAWDSLVARGLAQLRSNGSELSGGMPVYSVTDAGRIAAAIRSKSEAGTARLREKESDG